MRLNELFSPLREEEAYSAADLSPYEGIISEYFKKESFLYRGMKKTSPVIIGDGNSINRGSSASLAYFNWYTAKGEKWAKFPPRTKSFICTTRDDYARRYGYQHFVIPLENQVMGICPHYDFWASFKKINSVDGLNQALFEIFSDVQSRVPKTPDEMMSFIKEVDAQMLSGEYDPVEGTDRTSPYLVDISRAKSLSAYLIEATDPSLNGFKLSKEIPYYNHEVWLTGKVLFIEKQYAIEKGWFNEAK